jgi:hypothetical protein
VPDALTPKRIFIARRMAVRNVLASEGMAVETADAWCDAWQDVWSINAKVQSANHQWPASLETPCEPLVTSYAVQISNRIDPEESYL